MKHPKTYKVLRSLITLSPAGDPEYHQQTDMITASEVRADNFWVKFVDDVGSILKQIPAATVLDLELVPDPNLGSDTVTSD